MPANDQEPTRAFIVTVDGRLGDFMDSTGDVPLDANSYTSAAHRYDPLAMSADAKTYQDLFGAGGIAGEGADVLYGATIDVTQTDTQPDGSTITQETTYYLYRWFDVIDASQAIDATGDTAAFLRTVVGGSQSKQITLDVPDNIQTSFQGSDADDFDYGGSYTHSDTATWEFHPQAASSLDDPTTDTVTILSDGQDVGKVTALGLATDPTTIGLNLDVFESILTITVLSLQTDPHTGKVYYPYTETAGRVAVSQNVAQNDFPGFPLGLATYTKAQLQTMDTDIGNIASRLGQAVQTDFGYVNTGAGVSESQGYTVVAGAGDVNIRWDTEVVDDGDQVYGDYSNGPAGDVDLARDTLTPWLASTALSNAAKEWGLVQTLNELTTDTARVAVALNLEAVNTDLGTYIANSVDHEAAHAFGVNDGYYYPDPTDTSKVVNLPPFDVMAAGDAKDPDLTFGQHDLELMQAAIGLESSDPDVLRGMLGFYEGRYNEPDMDGSPFPPAPPWARKNEEPELQVSQGGNELLAGDTIAFHAVAADSPAGGEVASQDFVLTNNGYLPLAINTIALSDSQVFSIQANGLAGTSLDPGESATFTVEFSPSAAGQFADTLTVATNDAVDPSFTIELSGAAISSLPVAEFSLGNNNLGGVAVGSSATSAQPRDHHQPGRRRACRFPRSRSRRAAPASH